MRSIWECLIVAFKSLKMAYRKDGEQLFIRDYSDRTKDNVFKWKVSLDYIFEIFSSLWGEVRHRTVCPENLRLPQPWRFSRPRWMVFWAMWFRGRCTYIWQEVGTRSSLRSFQLSTQSILWLYELLSLLIIPESS